MIRNKGIPVLPTSRKAIRKLTSSLRERLGLTTIFCFPIVQFLEVVMPVLYPGFNYEYIEKTEMGNIEGLTIPEENMIQIREDVYNAAQKDEGRARFTIAHEIGHYIMHKDQTSYVIRVRSFARNEMIPPFRDAEWQADVWAAELLMPYHLIHDKTAYEVVEICKVSRSAAEYQLSKINE